MKDENWKNKRIKEIDNICKGNKDCHENFVDEVYNSMKAKQTLMMSLLQSKKKKRQSICHN